MSATHSHRGFAALQPVPRFWLFVVLSAVTTILTYQWWGLVISAVIVVGLFLLGGTYPRIGVLSALVAGALSFVGNLFLRHQGAVLFQLGALQITSGSLERATLLGLRLTVMILLAIAYISVTPNEDLLLTARGLRIPKTGEIYLMVVLRYIDILKHEFVTTMQAMGIRGIRWDGSMWERIQGLSQIPVPIIYRLIGHIHAQTLAIDSRGGVQVKTQLLAPPNPAIALQLENAAVTYQTEDEIEEQALAIHPTHLTVNRGDRLTLLGRTGSGRSSLLLLATGLIPHSTGRMAGRVRIFGYDTQSTAIALLAQQVRIVFPSAVHGLIGITVRDELALSLRTRAVDREQAEPLMRQTLRQVGLHEGFLDRKTLELSGGEMQRVALASALVGQPPMLLLDDVTGQLDPVGRAEVLQAIEKISKETTLLVADPNIHPLKFSRSLLLQQGKVTELPHGWQQRSQQLAQEGVRLPQLVQLAEVIGIPEVALGLEQAVDKLRGFGSESLIAEQLPRWKPANPVSDRSNSLSNCSPILETQDLSFAYRSRHWVLNRMNIMFYQGEFTAILGANGSGKTTLSLLLAKALKPTSGCLKAAPEVRVGYVFQEPTLQLLATTVADELAFAPRQLGWDADRVKAVVERELRRFGLPRHENPINLSPAQARLLAIAAILAMDAQVVILDEPTNGLDEIEIQSLMQQLTQLQQQGLTVILVTHDVEIACTYAQRLLVMASGQILLDGTPSEVMAAPEILQEAHVTPPAIAQLSTALWPQALPVVTVDQFVRSLALSLPSSKESAV